MKRVAILALTSICALFLASCADEEKDKPIPIDKTGATIPPKLVGRVASIPSDKRFVLIQAYGDWKISPGTILTTRGGDDRTANLLVTGEALGQFAAADLQAGTIDIGDAVYSRETPKVKVEEPDPGPIDTNATRPF